MSASLPDISPIGYEGPQSKNPLAFKHYHPAGIVEGRTMREHLRFSIVYWHTMCGQGADMFGGPTAVRPWEAGLSGIDLAKARVPVFFEIAQKLGMPFYAFHDRDVAPHGRTLRESNAWLDTAAAIRADGRLEQFIRERYASWDTGLGARIEKGKETFASLEAFALDKGEASASGSGRQEYLENLINEFI